MGTSSAVHDKVHVNVAISSFIYVANEVLGRFFLIANAINLPADEINKYREVLMDGLVTWLSTRHLLMITLEVVRKDRLEARFDFEFNYHSAPGAVQGQDKKAAETFENFVQQLDKVPAGCIAGIVAHVAPGAPEVRGWAAGGYRPTDHLERQGTSDSISSPMIGANFFFWRKKR